MAWYFPKMTTLTATKARARLSHWLKRAAAGDNIGIQCGERVIALRPMEPAKSGKSYARSEYGVTERELSQFNRRAKAEMARARRTGKMTRFTGDFHAAIGD